MTGDLRTASDHLHIRRCVACGSDDPSLDDVRLERCLCCGCDLRERPARSYAEMEGLPGDALPVLLPFPARPLRSRGVMHRWLLFFFMVGLVTCFALALIAEVVNAY